MPATPVISRRLPQLIAFDCIGDDRLGYIATTQQAERLPFAIKRAFWTYATPDQVVRGNHAHIITHELLVAVAGKLRIEVKTPEGETINYLLDTPDKGLHVSPYTWIRLHFEPGTVMLSLASHDFDVNDYLTDFEAYCQLMNEQGAKK
jgi:hypothetical protein